MTENLTQRSDDDPGPAPAPLAMGPANPAAREPTLDVLRGFAVLGILLVNVHFMLGGDSVTAFFGLPAGSGTGAATTADYIIQLLTTWLAMGKFMPALAMLFGVGAVLVADRAALRGVEPQPLLRRRYRWLAALGLAHMVLLFPGDVLFLYGVAGLVLIRWLHLSPRRMLKRAAVLLALGSALLAAMAAMIGWAMTMPDAAGTIDLEMERVAAVYGAGTYLDVVRMHAIGAPGYMVLAALMLPWTLALFLAGAAAARHGIAISPAAHGDMLRRAVAVGLGIGLPVNLALALGVNFSAEAGAMGAMLVGFGLNSVTGPLLATGYLAALALLCIRRGPVRRLAAVGRMALTAYMFQSVVMLSLLAGAGLVGRVDSAGALLIVAGTWAVLLAACPVWLRHFRFGPAEWLWRSLTYRKLQPMRA